MTRPQIKNLKICRTCFHPIRCGKYVQLQKVCSTQEPETVEEMLAEVVPEIVSIAEFMEKIFPRRFTERTLTRKNLRLVYATFLKILCSGLI